MKTHELIAILQKEDPEGNAEITVHNAVITHAERLPGYYDGSYQKVLYDKDHNPRLGVYCRKGDKVVIHYTTISDLLFDHPLMSVISDDGKAIEKQQLDDTRAEGIGVCYDIWKEYK